ncbi:MAG: hypothetical protein MUC97_10465 [Bernardetiaceae bacterium]|jgi:hypothetical protein|nr:hypothetical protein [Bernardetiaceae bacterium]
MENRPPVSVLKIGLSIILSLAVCIGLCDLLHVTFAGMSPFLTSLATTLWLMLLAANVIFIFKIKPPAWRFSLLGGVSLGIGFYVAVFLAMHLCVFLAMQLTHPMFEQGRSLATGAGTRPAATTGEKPAPPFGF